MIYQSTGPVFFVFRWPGQHWGGQKRFKAAGTLVGGWEVGARRAVRAQPCCYVSSMQMTGMKKHVGGVRWGGTAVHWSVNFSCAAVQICLTGRNEKKNANAQEGAGGVVVVRRPPVRPGAVQQSCSQIALLAIKHQFLFFFKIKGSLAGEPFISFLHKRVQGGA